MTDRTGQWIEFVCGTKMVSSWIIITIPESATSLALCEVEAYGAPIRSQVFLNKNIFNKSVGRTDPIRQC